MALPDKSTFASIGGEIIDFSAVEDPNTDLAGAFNSEVRADVAAMTRMIPRAYVAFTLSGTTCTVVEHDAVWGNDLAVVPTIVRTGTGAFTVTWPTTVTDARGTVHSLNLRRGAVGVECAGFFGSAKRASANSFTMVTYDSQAQAPADTNLSTDIIVLTVW